MPKPRTRTLLNVLRAAEVRPIEFLEVYLDPNATTPDFTFVNDPRNVRWNGRVYVSLAFQAGMVDVNSDGGQSTLQLTADDCDQQFLDQIALYPLAGARVEYLRAFVGRLADTEVAYTIFSGRGKDPQFVVGTMSWEIVSYLDVLDQSLPRRTFQRGCNHTLGGVGCGVDLTDEDYTMTGTAGATSTDRVLVDTVVLTQGAGYWDRGYVEITDATSPYRGVRRPIHRFDDGNNRLHFRYPFPVSLAGLAYKVVIGCKKTKLDCKGRFDNVANYGGFAEIPRKPEIPIGVKGGG